MTTIDRELPFIEPFIGNPDTKKQVDGILRSDTLLLGRVLTERDFKCMVDKGMKVDQSFSRLGKVITDAKAEVFAWWCDLQSAGSMAVGICRKKVYIELSRKLPGKGHDEDNCTLMAWGEEEGEGDIQPKPYAAHVFQVCMFCFQQCCLAVV